MMNQDARDTAHGGAGHYGGVRPELDRHSILAPKPNTCTTARVNDDNTSLQALFSEWLCHHRPVFSTYHLEAHIFFRRTHLPS